MKKKIPNIGRTNMVCSKVDTYPTPIDTQIEGVVKIVIIFSYKRNYMLNAKNSNVTKMEAMTTQESNIYQLIQHDAFLVSIACSEFAKV